MMRSNLSSQSQNQDIMARRASLPDRFSNLPADVTTIIFSRFEDDPKTLIRCSSVSKKWAIHVSKTVNLSLRLSCKGDNYQSLPCSQLHNHIPASGIPGIMKLLGNLKSLKIKVCHCPSPNSEPPCSQHVTKIKAEWAGDESETYNCTANEVGLLLTKEEETVALELDDGKFKSIENSVAMDLYWTILYYRPKSLESLVIMSAKIEEYSRSEGKVFISFGHLQNFPDSILNLRVNKRWLKDPANVIHWDQNKRQKEQPLQEQVWIFHQWQSLVTKERHEITDLFEEKADLMKLLDRSDDDERN